IGIRVRFLKWKLLRIHLSNQFFHFLAGLERHDVFGRDIHLVARARVPRLAGGAFLDLKDAEVPQLDPALRHQRLDDRVEGPLDDVLRLELSQTDILGNLLDNLFLGHDGDLRGAWSAQSGQRMAQVYWWLRVESRKKRCDAMR